MSPTALVVDDSAMDRHLAGRILEKHAGLTVRYANDGLEALAVIEGDAPDVVITDLQMPRMNGLELVKEIRAKHPLVPVILMTAHGSEEIAAAALHHGAASYVPKRNLAKHLVQTAERVLAAARSGHSNQDLFKCLTQTESSFLLENTAALVRPLVGHLQEYFIPMKLCDESGRMRLGVALEEALLNALYHGNLELSSLLREEGGQDYYKLAEERRRKPPYRDRRIHVDAKVSLAEAAYVVRDEGPGFDPSTLPDPTDPANLEKETGRGLLLIRTFMDEVVFNEIGNQITMIKRRNTDGDDARQAGASSDS